MGLFSLKRGRIESSQPSTVEEEKDDPRASISWTLLSTSQKAVRTSSALIYRSSPFSLPPSPTTLSGITRLDLAESGVEDISWLKGSQVTWLNLSGCRIKQGWDAVGSLQGLTGQFHIQPGYFPAVTRKADNCGQFSMSNDCGLDHLPKSLNGLGKMKAFVGMNNPWKILDDDVVASWADLNSLSSCA